MKKSVLLFVLFVFISISFVSASSNFVVLKNLGTNNLEMRSTSGSVEWVVNKEISSINFNKAMQDAYLVVDEKGAVYFRHGSYISKHNFFGGEEWSVDMSGFLNMRLVGGSLFVSFSSAVVELNRTTGLVINEYLLSPNALGNLLAVFDENADFVFFSGYSNMGMYDFRNDVLVKMFPNWFSYSFPSSAVVHNGGLYVTTYGNNVKKINIEEGVIEWISYPPYHVFNRMNSLFVDPVSGSVYAGMYNEAGYSYPNHRTIIYKINSTPVLSVVGSSFFAKPEWIFYGYEDVIPYSSHRPLLIVLDAEGKLYTRARETSIVLNSASGDELFHQPSLVYYSAFSMDESVPLVFSVIVSGSLVPGGEVFFDASNSYSVYSDSLSFEWFLDGVLISTASSFSFIFDESDTYELLLVVNDFVSGIYEKNVSVVISAPRRGGGGGGGVVEESRTELIDDAGLVSEEKSRFDLSVIQESLSSLSQEAKFFIFVGVAFLIYNYFFKSNKVSKKRKRRRRRGLR